MVAVMRSRPNPVIGHPLSSSRRRMSSTRHNLESHPGMQLWPPYHCWPLGPPLTPLLKRETLLAYWSNWHQWPICGMDFIRMWVKGIDAHVFRLILTSNSVAQILRPTEYARPTYSERGSHPEIWVSYLLEIAHISAAVI